MNNFSMLHFLGNLLLALAGVMMLVALFSLLTGAPDAGSFFVAVLVTAGAGMSGRLILYRKKEISLAESFSLVALAWVLAGAFGALPYYFYGVFDSYLDAFFESVSGFTTTGATLLEDIESLPEGIILWRSLTQWLGGMGIIVLFVAFLPRIGIRGINMVKAELPGPLKERVVPRVAQMAKYLWLIYVSLTLMQIILLMLSGVSLYLSVNHAFTTMPTGGFYPLDDSIAGLNNPAAEYITILFMFLAGVNFALYYLLLRRDYTPVLQNEELKFYAGVVVVSILVSFFILLPSYHAEEAFRKGAFQVVSIFTTTGYVTDDYCAWPSFLRTLLLFFMFFGGMGGSTGGSMKQARILLMLKMAFREVYRLVHPSVVSSVKLGKKVVQEDIIRGVSGFIFLYLFFHVVTTLLLSAMGLDLVTSFSASAASIGNVGPGLELVGPEETYQVIPAAGRLWLSLVMILGRLEIFTVLIFLAFVTRRY